ncbi:MAG: EamA family transporter [Melioribacteraceae bacterium]|nr:EamA family transporter [Melioribacteraceae bacterium]
MDWIILSLISAFFSAAAAITQKKVLFKLNALEFALLLSIFNVVFSLPILFIINTESISLLSLFVLYGKTILGAFAFLNVMLALKNLELSDALPMMVLTPGIVAVFAYIFLGETLTVYEISGMIALLIGTYVLELHHKKDLLSPFKIFFTSRNHRYITTALLLFTATSVLDKAILKDFKLEPNSFILFQHVFIAFNFSILAFFSKNVSKNKIAISFKYSWKLIALISVFTIVYRYTQIAAVKIAPVALVLSLKRISVFFASIIGGKMFNEHYLLRKSIAIIILLAGTLLILNS